MKDARSKILECVLVLERSKRRSVGPDEQGTREAVWARGKKLQFRIIVGLFIPYAPEGEREHGVNGVKAVVTVEI